MAFMGMVIAAIFILLVLGLFTTMIVMFIIGMVLRKKKKITSCVLLTISGIIFVLFAVGIISLIIPKDVEIETPEGIMTVKSNITKKYENAVYDDDLETVDSLLTQYPTLLYKLDMNSLDALQYYANNNNIDGVKCLLKHGAYFDNGVTLQKRITEYALSDYFGSINDSSDRETTEEMLKLMIDNGANVNYDNAVYSSNVGAIFNAVYWICSDSKIDDTEVDIVELIVESGANLKATNSAGDTPLEAFNFAYSGVSDENSKRVCAELSGFSGS